MIIRTQTDQSTEKDVIREDKEDMDMEEEGEGGEVPPTPADLPSREEEMREPSPEKLPYREESEVEMEEQHREKQERDKVERGRRKRRREKEHRGSKRSGEEPERRQLWPRLLTTYEEFPTLGKNLELWKKMEKFRTKNIP